LRYLRSSTSAPEEEHGENNAGQRDGDKNIWSSERNVEMGGEVFDGEGEGSGEDQEFEKELSVGRHRRTLGVWFQLSMIWCGNEMFG
jgi:hypothetical protein